ncbi:MAG: hypothetical protein JF588_11525 [Caulobacterales bacterium]|nr:hypothetical protein [Caulobacterales bacterium]
MKRLLLAAAAAACLSSPAYALTPPAAPAGFAPMQAACSGGVGETDCVPLAQGDTTVPIGVTTATTQEVIAAVAAKKIYVTSGLVMPNNTGTITFKAGTGANCATGIHSLTDAIPVTPQAGAFKPGFGLGADIVVPAGEALCLTTSATNLGLGYFTFKQR